MPILLGIESCKLVGLPVVTRPEGNLTFIEGGDLIAGDESGVEGHVPFPIARVYYLYGVPAGVERGGHAHKELQQLLVAASGSFDVVVDDGSTSKTITLDDPGVGLFMPTMIWRTLHRFSPGAVCLVLASTHFSEGDYYRDYDEFKAAVASS